MFKKAILPVLALAAASVVIPASASAQAYGHSQNRGPAYHQTDRNWTPISQRKFQLDRRIDQGLRNGALTRREANRLKSELNSLVRLETNYRRGGLTVRERADLDRRYDRLEAQVHVQRRDNQRRR